MTRNSREVEREASLFAGTVLSVLGFVVLVGWPELSSGGFLMIGHGFGYIHHTVRHP